MELNQNILAELATREYRELDLGEYATKARGQMLRVCVNAPGFVTAFRGGRKFAVVNSTNEKGAPIQRIEYEAENAEQERERKCKAVAILLEIKIESVREYPDDLLEWLFNESWRLHDEYQDALTKN